MVLNKGKFFSYFFVNKCKRTSNRMSRLITKLYLNVIMIKFVYLNIKFKLGGFNSLAVNNKSNIDIKVHNVINEAESLLSESSGENDRGRFELNPFEFLIATSVLICQKNGSSYGADIWSEIIKLTNREYASGAVYTGLNRLVKQDFISKVQMEDGKKHYILNPEGRKAISESRKDYLNLYEISAIIEEREE